MLMNSSYDTTGHLKFPLGIEVEVTEDAAMHREPECYHEHDEWCYTDNCYHECDEYCALHGCDHECDEACRYLSCDHAEGYCDCEQVPRKPEYVYGWEVVPDSSCGWEYVSEVIETENQLKTLIEDLFTYGDVITDGCCGVHIHVGNLSVQHVWNLAKLWEKVENAFLNFAEPWSSRMEFCESWEYMEPVPYGNASYELLQEWWYGPDSSEHDEYRQGYRYHTSRYRTLNLHSWFYRGTVEFRLFNGTDYKAELDTYVASVRFLINVVDLMTEGAMSLQEAVEVVKAALPEHRFDLDALRNKQVEKVTVGAA